jgi:uncharacterized phage protein (TIGR02218 family)
MTTYTALESSVAAGRPVEVYAFSLGATTWRYTTASQTVSYGGNDYEPAALSRSSIEDSDDVDKNRLTIKAPYSFALLTNLIGSAPAETVSVTILRGHIGADDFVTIWKGRVVSVSFGTEQEADITCESVFTSLRRNGLRRQFQQTCGHVLYGAACGVDKDAFAVTETVTVVSGTVLTVPGVSGEDRNYFAGGYIEYVDPDTGATARRMVTKNKGEEVTLATFPFGLSDGDSITLYPGCDHTVPHCTNKFNNYNRYGGMPFIPVNGNPFGSTRVF